MYLLPTISAERRSPRQRTRSGAQKRACTNRRATDPRDRHTLIRQYPKTMFRKIELHKNGRIVIESVLSELVAYGYSRSDQVLEEGDFSQRGEIIEIYPLGFELPVRIELNIDKIDRISSYILPEGRRFQEHSAVIVLPIKGLRPRKIKKKQEEYAEEYPINNFIDIIVI